MRIVHLPHLSTTLPTAVLLTTEGLAATKTAIAGLTQGHLEVTEAMATADEFTAYHTPQRMLWFYGLGTAQGLHPEKLRIALTKAVAKANEHKQTELQVVCLGLALHPEAETLLHALGETPGLAGYQFLPYKTKDREKLTHKLSQLGVFTDGPQATPRLAFGARVAEATNHARDLVNEPPNVLTQTELAARAEVLGQQYGFSVTRYGKDWIAQQQMGGLLAVNRGSTEPPTFTVLEHKPASATNAQPVVLVGKGIVFDTGGLDLKPSASMDTMKCDMAGAAAVIGTFCALAANEVPLYVVGLVPSTDNRPGVNAYTPNDVITFADGTTVEIRNTDAEGRLILADALLYAKRYNPALVIDLATLTGSAVIAIGSIGMPLYAKDAEAAAEALLRIGQQVYERSVRFPLWDDYAEQLKSDIADMKNIGGREAGSITAAKFLEHFTAYPWIHLDIAGPAFLESGKYYRPKNGTGWGVRLLTEFLRTYGR